MKNIYKFLIFILVLALATILVFYWQKNQPRKPVTMTKSPIEKIAETKVFYPKMTADNQNIIFLDQNRRLISFNLKNKTPSEKGQISLEQIRDVIWSPTKMQFLAKTDKADEIHWWFYDMEKNTQKDLGTKIQNPIWSITGEKIFYQFFDEFTDKNELSTANPDGSSWRQLANLPSLVDYQLFLLDSERIILLEEPSDVSTSKISLFNLKSLKLDDLIEQNGNVEIIIPPDKNRFFFRNPAQPLSVQIYDINGKNQQTFGQSFDFHKFVWQDKDLIFAIRESGKNSDNFYKINLETGKKTTLYQSTDKDSFEAINLMLTQDNKTLYFTSNNYLYKLNLP